MPLKYKTEPWWVKNRGNSDLIMGNEEEYFERLTNFINISCVNR